MAEELGQDRTEPATPRRREEAREQGQVAYSSDLVGAAVLMVGVVSLFIFGPSMGQQIFEIIRQAFLETIPTELGPAEAQDRFARLFWQSLSFLGPVLGLLVVVGIGTAIAQVGFFITPDRLGPDFDKLSPASGWQKLFSWSAVLKGVLALLKIAVLAALVWVILRPRIGIFTGLGLTGAGDVAGGAQLAWSLAIRLALYLAGAFLLLGILDFIYQKYRLEESLKMTRQEIKEEQKREDGDPQIKLRMRALQRERNRKRMLAEVPQATVVVTNPTHVAVALLYKEPHMKTPRVVAKGAGDLARRIADTARQHGVPVFQRPPLARALYKTVEVDQEIPGPLFGAVAQVIAFVQQFRDWKGGVDSRGGQRLQNLPR